MESKLALVISIFSFAIATLSYYLPRKPGGAVQWQIEIDNTNFRGQIKHVGSGKARNLIIKTNSVLPAEPIQRKVSYPQDVFSILVVRTMGVNQPSVSISWRNVLRIRQERNYDL